MAKRDRLSLDGRIIDTFEFNRCCELHYVAPAVDEQPSILLKLTNTEAELTLRLSGVRSLQLPDTEPHIWITELDIIDVRDRQLEGIRFHVVSEDGFACYCAAIQCIEYKRLD